MSWTNQPWYMRNRPMLTGAAVLAVIGVAAAYFGGAPAIWLIWAPCLLVTAWFLLAALLIAVLRP